MLSQIKIALYNVNILKCTVRGTPINLYQDLLYIYILVDEMGKYMLGVLGRCAVWYR